MGIAMIPMTKTCTSYHEKKISVQIGIEYYGESGSFTK